MNPALNTYNPEEVNRLLSDEFINSSFSLFNIQKIKQEGREAIKPPPDITISDWADQNIVLPETSSEPGRFRTSRVPHTKDIMNCTLDPRVRELTIVGSSQIVKTQTVLNIIGYHIDIDPCAIMIMQPDDKAVKDFVTQKLDTMIEDCECLRNKVKKKKSRDTSNSTYYKKFIGGHLITITGRSVGSTRGRSIRLTWDDDCDAIELGSTKEGDPVARLKKRSTTFPDSLNIHTSTPSIDGSSRIWNQYLASNKQKRHVVCPYCGLDQVLDYLNLDWDKDRDMFGKVIEHHPETVRYKCPCGAKITEGERIEMLGNGKWVAEKPWIIVHQGFLINELSSTVSTMQKIVETILDAKCDIEDRKLITTNADPSALEALINTTFGLPYKKIQGEKIDPIGLTDRVEDYIDKDNLKVPNEVLMLTAAVDVQEGMSEKSGRLEIKVMGWGRGKERWVIYRRKILGNPRIIEDSSDPDTLKNKSVWKQLDEFWEKKWFRKDGVQLKIVMKLVDSQYATRTVYKYTTGRSKDGIFALKSANKYSAPLIPMGKRMSIVNHGKTLLLIIGSQAAKADIYTSLYKEKIPGPGYTHFTKCYCDSEYFKELTAEVAVETNGHKIYQKENAHDANESLDLYVYNFCAMEFLDPDWDSIEKSLKKQLANKLVDEITYDTLESTRDMENVNKETGEIIEEAEVIEEKKPASVPQVKKQRKNFVNSW